MAPERTLREAHPTERAVGIEYYVSDADGIGGRLRVERLQLADPEVLGRLAEPIDAEPGSY
ncbi:hypothetical protein DJ71_05450, partial [Halorubrum sp. E3]